jgi:hypothetical protein
MSGHTVAHVTPAQLVRAPAGYSLYQRITVTNGAGGATLVSLLTGGILPRIPVAGVSGPAGQIYSIKFVDLSAETDPATVKVRYTDDGQTTPTATLGFVIPAEPAFVRIPCDPQDIKLISAGANVNIQVKLGIMGTTTGDN